jgi:hypothetical protein
VRARCRAVRARPGVRRSRGVLLHPHRAPPQRRPALVRPCAGVPHRRIGLRRRRCKPPRAWCTTARHVGVIRSVGSAALCSTGPRLPVAGARKDGGRVACTTRLAHHAPPPERAGARAQHGADPAPDPVRHPHIDALRTGVQGGLPLSCQIRRSTGQSHQVERRRTAMMAASFLVQGPGVSGASVTLRNLVFNPCNP